MNKLDLKDYLYNLYSVETLHVRSYIIHGKVRREQRTGSVYRRPQRKKMTIEMKSGDNFLWPDAPEDLGPWDKTFHDARAKEREAVMEGSTDQGQDLRVVPREERMGVREMARELLGGKVGWRPGWEKYMTGTEPQGGESREGATM